MALFPYPDKGLDNLDKRMDKLYTLFHSIMATEILFAGAVVVFFYFVFLLLKSLQTSRSHLILLVFILALGLGLRAFWIYAAQPLPRSDFGVYWQYANNFYHGDLTYNIIIRHPGIILLYTLAFYLLGPSLQAVWYTNLVFSLVMMLVMYALGKMMLGGSRFQTEGSRLQTEGSLLQTNGSLTPDNLQPGGCNHLAEWAGLLAALLTALEPQLISYTALMASETASGVFALMVLWGILHARGKSSGVSLDSPAQPVAPGEHASSGRPCVLYWLALGWMLYGTIILRSSNLLFLVLLPVVILLFDWWQKRSRWTVALQRHLKQWVQRYVLLAVTTGVLLSSWVFHQYLVGGEPRLFWGDDLWLACAVQYQAGGHIVPYSKMSFYPQIKPDYERWAKDPSIPNEIKLYESIHTQVWRIILEDPGKFLWTGLDRLKSSVWKSSQTGIRWSEKGSKQLRQFFPGKGIYRLSTVSNVFWQVLLILSSLGLLHAFSLFRKQANDLALAEVQKEKALSRDANVLVILYVAAWLVFYYLLSYAAERYTYQIIPFVILLAASGIIWGWNRIAGRLSRYRRPALPESG